MGGPPGRQQRNGVQAGALLHGSLGGRAPSSRQEIQTLRKMASYTAAARGLEYTHALNSPGESGVVPVNVIVCFGSLALSIDYIALAPARL